MTVPKFKPDWVMTGSIVLIILCLGIIIKTLNITGDSLPSSPTILNNLTSKI